jgi:hypothetical protein
MPDKLIFVKAIEQGIDRKQKPYLKTTDQDNVIWYLFNQDARVEVNKAYLFTFATNDKGFTDIQKITPGVRIFHQKALKEVTNKNDIWRNFSVSFSYAKDLVVGNQIKLDDIFAWSDKIYEYLQTKTDKIFEAKPNEPNL